MFMVLRVTCVLLVDIGTCLLLVGIVTCMLFVGIVTCWFFYRYCYVCVICKD